MGTTALGAGVRLKDFCLFMPLSPPRKVQNLVSSTALLLPTRATSPAAFDFPLWQKQERHYPLLLTSYKSWTTPQKLLSAGREIPTDSSTVENEELKRGSWMTFQILNKKFCFCGIETPFSKGGQELEDLANEAIKITNELLNMFKFTSMANATKRKATAKPSNQAKAGLGP
ncbi:hypothetical protein K432DRAFT_392878 [Lepidopterella palustris CBS 459.81]|uniref:Uncharacterized protein n=1 Tax=Lepidopterella palustris CBS 459.81 TaxID=1314670 RepID=A0A8E2JFN8_9PEZI|nr:hypothetical protein K432DRAFT_392878 [Lepidopterella palustris CBS 459.81]